MSFLKRLRNIWKLSSLDLTISPEGKIETLDLKPSEEPPRMAQIVSIKNPVKEFLSDKQE